MSMEGPFGAGNGQVPDLGAIKQIKELAEHGIIPLPILLQQIGGGIINELVGIRQALLPMDVKTHVPVCTKVVDEKTNEPVGWMVFCMSCSDMAGEFIYPCRIVDTTNWPPNIVVPGAYAQSPEQMPPVKLPEDDEAPAEQP